MKFSKSFKIALNIIIHSKLRSWLTIIGIIIGIGSIVTIVSMGQGAQKTVENSLNSFSADILTVSPGFSRAAGAGANFRVGSGGGGGGFGEGGGGQATTSRTAPKNLTLKDVTIIRSVPNVIQVMGTVSGNAQTTFLGKSARVSVEGVDPAVWKNIVSTPLYSGRYLIQGDENVVVIGGRVANSTFTNMDINRLVTIGNYTYKIVGILQQTGGQDDRSIFMPIDNAVTVLDGKDIKDFDSITVKIKDISQSTQTVDDITSKLMISHGILQASKVDFSVNSLQSVQARISSTLGSLALFLEAIAAISLIVGAIGIMNTMFTSVLEKTRDIGILKAIGAKNSDILTIFLLNAAIIGLIGGILGVIIGYIAASFAGQLVNGTIGSGNGNPLGRLFGSAYISWQLVLGVFLLSIIVGLISGVIPAYRASKLKPVDALRYE